MLRGIDISHYQKNLDSKIITGADFVIMKASEGKSFKDPRLDKFYNLIHGSDDGLPDSNKLYGFYHYARPEKNDPIPEAKQFVKLVRHHAGEAMYCLDWEGVATKYPVEWILEWMSYVENETGVKPLLYVSESQVKKYQKVAERDYGLWVAKWSTRKPNIKPWKIWALWQYTVDHKLNLDMDYFNGTAEQFKKYCRRS